MLRCAWAVLLCAAAATVVAKVLFSAATADDFEGADILAGSPAWHANLITKRTPLDYSLQLSVALNAMASGEFVNPCGAGPGPRGAAAPLAKGQKVYDVIR